MSRAQLSRALHRGDRLPVAYLETGQMRFRCVETVLAWLVRRRAATRDGPAVVAPDSEPRPTAEGCDRTLVLVVEDNPDMSRFLVEALQDDYRTAVAADGQEGLEQALALRPDVILSDIMMPRLSGDRLVYAVRSRRELDGIPIIVLTAKADDELRVRLLREGAQDYVMKPVRLNELRARVGNLVASKRRQEASRRALEESERRHRLIARASHDAIWDWNLVTDQVARNEGFLRLFGYVEGEVGDSVSWWAERVHPEDRERVVAGLRDALAHGDRSWSEEYRFRRRDGSDAVVMDRGYVLRDETGRGVRMIGSMTDVTERRRAEEQLRASVREKELLLREIHHRVKNNLQTIYSLLRLQSGLVKDPEALQVFKESQERVRSIALLHDTLYRSKDLSRIAVGDYIRSVTANLFRTYGASPERVQLAFDVDPVTFGIDTAIPCGLIINELVSNSLKHAFPDDRTGRIAISLRANPDATYTLTVADDGVGPPPPPAADSAASFGQELVRMLTRQLEGTLDCRHNGGTEWRIVFRELKYHDRT